MNDVRAIKQFVLARRLRISAARPGGKAKPENLASRSEIDFR
jgi:hypothetical protein